MARRATLVELTARRDRLEKRALRIVRETASGGAYGPLLRAAWDLVKCDSAIREEERKIRRAVRKLAR